MAVRIDLVRVRHFPRPACRTIVISHRFRGCGILFLVREERVAVFILCAPYFTGPLSCVDLEDCVLGAVDVWVDAQAEEMLMVMRVHAWVNFCAPSLCIFTGVHSVGIQDPGELNLQLYGSVLVEDPIDAILVIRCREYVGDEEFPASSHDDGVISEIGMFEQDPGVFFVDADCILDGLAGAGAVDEGSVHVVDCSLAVAAQGEAVCHVSASVFAEIEGVLAVMRVLGVAVRDNHFRERESVKDGSFVAFVVVGNVV